MADNTTLNAGTGGDVIGSDDIGGVKFQRVKLIHGADGTNAGDVSDANALPALLTGEPAGSWPNYSGPSDQAQRPASIDDDGALIVRGAVLTDEGTFRCNFANTSLWAGIGSVTVSGATVTGTGFLATDCHRGDYFKIAADADTLAVQIASIDSDTQITLRAAYAGSTSGTGQRAVMLPFAGTGGSTSVASGQLTITAGTTATSQTGVKRYVDYGPLVYRARGNISQRIANQGLRAGLREDATTPRWFGWFLLDGTVNTTVKCQTARNPTGAPSAAETQETTVTLPNGATTATARDWRVELLTESVRFYVDSVLVAEHSVTIPHQHDEMAAVYEFVNGTTPATGTTAVVDYCTGKNHNKVEIGVLSDAEKIVASQPPVQEFLYSQDGVIAINTVLMVIDCSQLRGLSIQCASMGTTGVVTPEWSNDPEFAQVGAGALILTTAGSGPSATFKAAGVYVTNVYARYLRLRLSTATTAGTTTLRVAGFQHPIAPSINIPVTGIAGTVAVTAAAGTAAIGDVGIQVRANATGAGSVSKIASAATTNATSVKASAGRVFGYHFTNTTAAVKVVRFYNLATAPTVGTSVPVYNVVIPANGYVSQNFPHGRGHSTGIAYAITNAIADLDATAVAANDVIGAIDFA